MTAHILTNNLAESATVTADISATGFNVVNSYDRRTSTWWKPGSAGGHLIQYVFASAQSINSFGIIGHNLFSTGVSSFQFQYSTNSGAAWNDYFSAITPTSDKAIYRVGAAAQSATYWRLFFTGCSSSTLLAVASIGLSIPLPSEIPLDFTPPKLARNKKITNSKTETGNFIGRSVINSGVEFDVSQNYVTKAWMDSNYEALINNLEVAPFFFSWDYENYLNDPVYAYLRDAETKPKMNNPNLYTFNLSCQGELT